MNLNTTTNIEELLPVHSINEKFYEAYIEEGKKN